MNFTSKNESLFFTTILVEMTTNLKILIRYNQRVLTITVQLTSCLTGLDLTMQLKLVKFIINNSAESKQFYRRSFV